MDNLTTKEKFVIGLDFGSDSVRALIVNVSNGEELSSGVAYYPRWAAGKYCVPAQAQFRHHPQDYIGAMTDAVKTALALVSAHVAQSVIGIGVDECRI
ncbi:hypothetical protein P4S72_20190 [Vibrio sp. PP-XX7]